MTKGFTNSVNEASNGSPVLVRAPAKTGGGNEGRPRSRRYSHTIPGNSSNPSCNMKRLVSLGQGLMLHDPSTDVDTLGQANFTGQSEMNPNEHA